MSDNAKTLIKKAAMTLFAQNGFRGTSVRQISNSAGVNIASISYHFGSKDGLLKALFQDIVDGDLSGLVASLKPAANLEEFKARLEIFTRGFIHSNIRDNDIAEMIYRNLEHFAEHYPELFESTFGTLHKNLNTFFESARERNIVRQDVPAMITVQMFMSSLTDIVRNRTFRRKLLGFAIEDPKSVEYYVDTLIKCFINGVKSEAS